MTEFINENIESIFIFVIISLLIFEVINISMNKKKAKEESKIMISLSNSISDLAKELNAFKEKVFAQIGSINNLLYYRDIEQELKVLIPDVYDIAKEFGGMTDSKFDLLMTKTVTSLKCDFIEIIDRRFAIEPKKLKSSMLVKLADIDDNFKYISLMFGDMETACKFKEDKYHKIIQPCVSNFAMEYSITMKLQNGEKKEKYKKDCEKLIKDIVQQSYNLYKRTRIVKFD